MVLAGESVDSKIHIISVAQVVLIQNQNINEILRLFMRIFIPIYYGRSIKTQ